MDVGAKNDVIHIIRDLRERGLAIIVLSTEPETVLSLADRIIVAEARYPGARIRQRDHQQRPTVGSGMRRSTWRPVKA